MGAVERSDVFLLPSCGGRKKFFVFFNKVNKDVSAAETLMGETGSPVKELTHKCEGGTLCLLKDHLAVAHHQPVVDLLGGRHTANPWFQHSFATCHKIVSWGENLNIGTGM